MTDTVGTSGPASTSQVSDPAAANQRPRAGTGTVALFAATSFLGSLLLFLVEPMVAKMLLPLLGGSPAVWNTAMVFFQAALLSGYALAHLMISRLGIRRQSLVQMMLFCLPLLVMPVAVPSGWRPPPDAEPALWTLLALTVMVGAPFLMLSTASPTIQRWFADTDHPQAGDPYFLYAAGNVGSFVGLLAYPFVLEPRLTLDEQSWLWSGLYACFVVLAGCCTVALRRHPATTPARSSKTAGAEAATPSALQTPVRIDNRTRGRWIYLAAIPSALLLGVTRHISSDIAAIPLLWVVPLSLYLITFVVAFGRSGPRTLEVAARGFRLLVVPVALTFLGLISSLWVNAALHLLAFFFAALVAHGRLAAERPAPEKLTEFYLLLSLGGMIGGVVTALVAPVVFSAVLEYPIAIVLAITILPPAAPATGLVVPWRKRMLTLRTVVLSAAFVALTAAAVTVRSAGTQQALQLGLLIAATGLAGAYALARSPHSFAAAVGFLLFVATAVPAYPTVYQSRTFFGVHRVYQDPDGRHVLLNGTTVHAMEAYRAGEAGVPLAYFHPSGPMGQFFDALAAENRPRTMAIIGLGAGAIAAYGEPGDRITYYEIDPEVVRIAEDPNLFSFVTHSAATVDYVIGDGRLNLAAASKRYDIVMVDAFSSDSVPLHLLTREAMAIYLDRLAEGGVIVFNISNRYFDFVPVLGKLASEFGLTGIVQRDHAISPELAAEGKFASTFALLARNRDDLRSLKDDPRWEPIGDGGNLRLWTDSYTDLLGVLAL